MGYSKLSDHRFQKGRFITPINNVKYGWRETCENGFEYGLDPEDFETEEEYEEALDEAKDPFGGIF